MRKAHLVGIRWRRLLGPVGWNSLPLAGSGTLGSDALRKDGRRVVARVANGCFDGAGNQQEYDGLTYPRLRLC